MTVKRRDFQKASALIHEFLLKLSEDGECAELRDSLNLALLYMQRYYRLLRVRVQQQQQPAMPNGSTTPSALTQSLRGLSPMTPFRDTPDKFVWKWISVESPRLMETLPVDIDKEHFARIPLIVQAAKTGNNNTLMQLIEKDPDCIFEIDTLGRNALMYAVHFGHLDTIQHLLEQGTDVNATALDGSTVVHIACHDNQHEALEILIHYGANLQIPDHLGRTPIHWACAKPQRECLKLLLDNGVSTKLRDNDGMTPSMWACRMDHIEHFELLTSAENQNGVEDEEEEEDGFERDYTGKTWIHWSIRRSDPHECLKTLLTEDAANLRDKEGRSAILVAADQGSLAATKIVLEIAGMSCLDHRDLNNRSPLILATMGGHGEVVNCLLSSGADFTAVDNFSATAWDYARNRQLHYCMLILASYIRQLGGADVGGTLNGDEMLHNGIGNDAGSRGQLVEEGLGINQLQINGEESQQLFYSSQPVAPRPPTQPVTPRAPKRTPRQSHPPNTPRQSHSPTPRAQHLAVTPSGAPQKRSPSTPVEVREEEQLFEMNERGTSSAGSMSKRLRAEGGGSPNRGMSVMSVESYDDQRLESAGSHRTRPRSAPEEDEPEIPSNSQYIEPVEEGHGEEAESVSIDAMDVSDFDADIEEEVSTRQDPSPNKDYIQQQRPPPPSGSPPSYAPSSPSNHHQAPPSHYQDTYPPQPPPSQQQYTAPSVPSSHPPSRPPPPYHSGLPQHHQPGTSPLLQSGGLPHHQPGDSPQPHSPPYKSYPPPRPPPSRGTNPQHHKPASQQYVPQPGDYVEGPRDEDVVSDDDYDAPVAPVPTPRGKPPSPQHIPAHLSPIPMGEPQKRKKRKKRKDRPDHLAEIQHAAPVQYHHGYSSQPAAPGPIVHPPPTPQRRESSPQRNPPPSSMDKGPTSSQEHGSSHKLGYVSHQGNSQSHGQREKQSFSTKPPPSGLRPPALKVQAQSRQQSDHQEEQSFALDQSTLKVSKAGSSGHSSRPPPLSRSSALPPASSPPSYTLPPHQNRLTNSSDSTPTHNARNRKDEPRKSDILTAAEGRSRSQSGGQRFSHQNGIPPGRGPPPTQNGPMTNSRSPRISAGGPSLGTTRGDHSRRNSPSPPKHKPPHQPPPWSQQQQQQPNGQLPSSAGPRQY